MNEVEALKEQWLATRSFDDEQRYLRARVQQGEVPCVEINPGGDWLDWLGVVVRRPTEVVYRNQVGGVTCHQYLVEGFLVMIGPWKYEPDGTGMLVPVKLDLDAFRSVFHQGKHCVYVPSIRLPADRLETLRRLVADIRYWRNDGHGPSELPLFRCLSLDESRIDEMAEAWIPVDTSDGPGVLLYDNCD